MSEYAMRNFLLPTAITEKLAINTWVYILAAIYHYTAFPDRPGNY